jgi:hypothetical protein
VADRDSREAPVRRPETPLPGPRRGHRLRRGRPKKGCERNNLVHSLFQSIAACWGSLGDRIVTVT